MKVLVWNENVHEREQPEVAAIYPKGMHGCIAEFLSSEDITVTTATLDMPNQGLSEELLADTDVLVWWGHRAHEAVTEANVELLCRHINGGMGLVALHSAHHSRLFKRLMGASCNLKWRHGDRERVWCALPSHPIAKGVPEHFELPREQMYGEPFDIPAPDEVVFLGWFAGGEVFRSGVTYRRGAGKIFYFQPGHEEYPIFHDKNIQQIIKNAVEWACPVSREHKAIVCENAAPLEGGSRLD
ncbi:MAG: ThuA domain-containing protein [Oscillospiraceae bacterium]|nr:ThuA domain-containing protein [Oscillospiraceae bacterium]